MYAICYNENVMIWNTSSFFILIRYIDHQKWLSIYPYGTLSAFYYIEQRARETIIVLLVIMTAVSRQF